MEAPERAEREQRISEELVRRIRGGDSAAEHIMIQRYGKGLLYLLRRSTSDLDLAQDLRQETFRIAIEKLRSSTLDEPGRLAAYLRGVALNLVSADWRKTRRRATSADSVTVEATGDDGPGPFDEVSREQVGLAVKTVLAEMPVERDREILRRLYMEEQDRAEICAALGLDAAHFNRVLFRAKQRFKDLLQHAVRRRNLRLVR